MGVTLRTQGFNGQNAVLSYYLLSNMNVFLVLEYHTRYPYESKFEYISTRSFAILGVNMLQVNTNLCPFRTAFRRVILPADAPPNLGRRGQLEVTMGLKPADHQPGEWGRVGQGGAVVGAGPEAVWRFNRDEVPEVGDGRRAPLPAWPSLLACIPDLQAFAREWCVETTLLLEPTKDSGCVVSSISVFQSSADA